MSIVLFTDMPHEVGAAAFYQSFDKTVIPVPMKTHEAYSFSTTVRAITTAQNYIDDQSIKRFVLFGTYWQKYMTLLIQWINKMYVNADVFILCDGKFEFDESIKSRINHFPSGTTGPISFIKQIVSGCADEQQKQLFETYCDDRKQIVEFIENKGMNIKVPETQVFFSGFYNHVQGATNYEKFMNLFKDPTMLIDVLYFGKLIASAQTGTSKERTKGVQILKLKNGASVVVAESPELIELTHDQLCKNYNTDVTIVFKFVPTPEGTMIHYSVRSYDEKYDAREIIWALVGKENGGGNDWRSSGGRCFHSIPLLDRILAQN
jgi:hypothetical protein